MPRYFLCARVFVAILAALATACGRTQETEAPVATPSITLSRAEAAAGTPIEMAYRFAVAPSAPPFNDDYWVFVHFLDTDGELMWTDDHQPPTAVRQWKPGQEVTYQRTMFVPKFPYVGETRIEVGLFSPKSGARLPMNGETKGQRSYQVGKFSLRLQSDNLYVVFKDGWHETEVAQEGGGTEWQWSKKNATVAFRNPMRDVIFYLQCDQPVQGLGEPQHVELRIGPAVIDRFDLPSGQRALRKIPVTKAQVGDAETVEITVAVDRTFVPAAITRLNSSDPRELGIRVFRAYVEPK